jgi:hypothetical protein
MGSQLWPCTALQNPSLNDKVDAASASSPVQETKDSASTPTVQSEPIRPLWTTPDGQIAKFKHLIEKNLLPQQRANFEALIRYYEDGGKIPQGDEEVWADEREIAFGTRKHTSFEQIPKEWWTKTRFLDVSGF